MIILSISISDTSIRKYHKVLLTWLTKIRILMSNYIHWLIRDVITEPCHNFKCALMKMPLKLGYWRVSISPLFYVEVITYSCPNHNAGIANIWEMGKALRVILTQWESAAQNSFILFCILYRLIDSVYECYFVVLIPNPLYHYNGARPLIASM